MEQLTLNTDRGQLRACYSRGPDFLFWAGRQSGLNNQIRAGNREAIRNGLGYRHRHNWQRRWGQGVYNLPDTAVCTEIGSGVGINAIWSAQYLPRSQWHLVDSLEPNVPLDMTTAWPQWTEDGGLHYNSGELVDDGIATSGMTASRFTQNPLGENPWPKSDMIMSAASWCYHYPTEVYLDRVVDSLKPGGLLWVSIRVNDADDSRTKISQALGVEPLNQVTYDRHLRMNDLEKITDYSKGEYWLVECLWRRPE